jgi:hypothetical protein
MMRAIADRGGLGQEAADRKWSLSQVMGLAFASSVALLGIVASIRVGCPRWFRTSFYVTGLVLLILWSPRRPPALLPEYAPCYPQSGRLRVITPVIDSNLQQQSIEL